MSYRPRFRDDRSAVIDHSVNQPWRHRLWSVHRNLIFVWSERADRVISSPESQALLRPRD